MRRKAGLKLFMQIFIASWGADVLLALGQRHLGSSKTMVKTERTKLETGYTTVSA
jgi:hypothetical protein